jgi:hypothetical protein
VAEVNEVFFWVMTPQNLVGGLQRSGEMPSRTLLSRCVSKTKAAWSDKQKGCFIKRPIVLSFMFEVIQ